MILRPKNTIKTKELVSIAHKNDWSGLLDFDNQAMDFRTRIVAIEKRMMELPQVEIPIEHHFGAGIYARTMVAPRGTMITGRIYKVPQMIIISRGKTTVRSEDFNGLINGPHIYNSPIGTKRFIYCHTDVVWTCLMAVESTDVESVEKEIYTDSYEELDCMLNNDTILLAGV